MRLLPLLLLLLAATASAADGATAIDVAVEAEAAHSRWCSDVASRGTSEAAAANTEVSAVWEKVSRAFGTSGDVGLRYWRGVLGQCIGHEERAIEDYRAFIEGAADDPVVASQVRDARKRLRRLGVEERAEAPAVSPGLAGVVGGAAAAVAGGILHGASFAQAGLTRTADGWSTTLDRAAYDAAVADWDGANKAGFGLLVGGGVAVAVGLAVAAGTAAGRPAISAGVGPVPGGVVVALGGRF